jgi:hypothetical protein
MAEESGSSNPIHWVIVSGIATLAFAFFPLNELAYLCFGKTASAQVVSVQEYKGRRTKGFDVTYQYKDSGGNPQTDTDSWHFSEGAPSKADIVYRSFPYTSSRRAGTIDWIGLILFAISAGATGFLYFVIVRQVREFRAQEQERAKRRKKKKKVVEDDEEEDDED